MVLDGDLLLWMANIFWFVFHDANDGSLGFILISTTIVQGVPLFRCEVRPFVLHAEIPYFFVLLEAMVPCLYNILYVFLDFLEFVEKQSDLADILKCC